MTEQELQRSQTRAQVLKALAHPTRVFMVEKLQQQPHCVCELAALVGADTSTISKHLSMLKNVGIVTTKKVGTTVYYSLSCTCISRFFEGIEEITRRNVANQNFLFKV